MALLVGVPSACLAGQVYDRNLERAVMDIVARKMDAPMRGTLHQEWRPTASMAALPDPMPTNTLPPATVHGRTMIDPLAVISTPFRAAISIIELAPPQRSVRIVYR